MVEHSAVEQDRYETELDGVSGLDKIIKSRTLLFQVTFASGEVDVVQSRCSHFVLSSRCLPGFGPGVVFESWS